jgi:hypothetical protein
VIGECISSSKVAATATRNHSAQVNILEPSFPINASLMNFPLPFIKPVHHIRKKIILRLQQKWISHFTRVASVIE